MNYPAYYRLRGRCIKVVGPTEAKEILLPEPGAYEPIVFHTIFPTEDRMKEDVAKMHVVDEEVFESFICQHSKESQRLTALVSAKRQKRYDSINQQRA